MWSIRWTAIRGSRQAFAQRSLGRLSRIPPPSLLECHSTLPAPRGGATRVTTLPHINRGTRHAGFGVLLLAGVVLLGCGRDSERPGGSAAEPRRGGKVVVAVDVEPQTLNSYLVAGSLALNAFIADKVVLGAWRVTPDFGYAPALLAGEPVVSTDPFTVTYSIRPDAVWSDGAPVTARDFEFTWQTVMNPQWQIAVREGYEEITQAEIIDAKTVRFAFREPYGHWRLLFLRGGVLPAHRLEGRNFNDVWKDGFDVASGPFLFREWVKGDHLTLAPNPRYFGEKPHIDEIEIRFIPDSNTMFQQFRSGDVDVFSPSAQNVESVRDMKGVSFTDAPGAAFAQLGFNVADELLDDARIRRAIAFGIDRAALVKAAFGRQYPDVEPLNSLVYLQTQKDYVGHFERYTYDPAKARELLDAAGCPRNGDEVRRCGDRALSFTVLVPAGNEPLRLLFETLQSQLKESGVRVTGEFLELNRLFADAMSGKFQFALEAFGGAPEPVLADLTWTCGGSFNFRGFCDREASALLNDAARQLDREAAAALYNRADAVLAENPPALPLVQVPLTLAWHERVRGPILNPAFFSPFWNAEEWFVAR